MSITIKRSGTLDRLLKTAYPVIQAPMLGVTTPQMVAAIAAAGGLGSLPVGGLPPEKTRELIHDTKARTRQPFAVNLFAHHIPDRVDEDSLQRMQDFLEKFCQDNHLPFHRRTAADLKFYNHLDQLEILLDEDIRIVSFTFGILPPEMVAPLKNKGVVLIGTATSLEEALALQSAGVDVVVAQGIEAGGHRGSFLDDGNLPQIGLFSLLPQMADKLPLPIVAAGGIYDGKTIKAAFDLGAQAVQIGSLFIAANESAVPDAHKDAVIHTGNLHVTLTKALSGRWARGIRNKFMTAIEASGLPLPDYTVQNALTAPVRAYAQQKGLTEYLSMWAGQSASRAERRPAGEIFKSLVGEIRFED